MLQSIEDTTLLLLRFVSIENVRMHGVIVQQPHWLLCDEGGNSEQEDFRFE